MLRCGILFVLVAVVKGFGLVDLGSKGHECIGWSMGIDMEWDNHEAIYDDYKIYYGVAKANGFPEHYTEDGKMYCTDDYGNTAFSIDDEGATKVLEVFFNGGAKDGDNYLEGFHNDGTDDFYINAIGYDDFNVAIDDDELATKFGEHRYQEYTGKHVTSVLVWANYDTYYGSISEVVVKDTNEKSHTIFKSDADVDDSVDLCGEILRFDVPKELQPLPVLSVAVFFSEDDCCYHEIDAIAITYEEKAGVPCPEPCSLFADYSVTPDHPVCAIPEGTHYPSSVGEMIQGAGADNGLTED